MKKWLSRIAIFFSIIFISAFVIIYFGFRASLPNLDENVETAFIKQAVMLERDENGNATISGGNRADVSYVTGFLHAQERFFQMDLSRRMAAGELSGLFGELALTTDKRNRIHRFRSRATKAISLLPPNQKELLDQYVKGVNDGLEKLGSKPFEYWLLQAEPKEWVVEDSFLAIYSMFFTLQSSGGGAEWQEHLLRQSLDSELVDFLLPLRTDWDAPLQEDKEKYNSAEIPSAPLFLSGNKIQRDDEPMVGSNNWAVSGNLTSTGAAMVADDMHLTIRAPSIWYKLRLKLNDGSLDITGVSLPGAPAIVVGSNRHVAWGFTNSNIDTSDIIQLKINPKNENQYLTKDGYIDFTEFSEEIEIKGASSEVMMVKETIWGPVMDLQDGKQHAYRWVAHLPDAVNMSLINMENVRTVQDTLAISADMGVPTQNALIVDKKGNVAWTYFGKLPKRGDFDYHKVMDWSSGEQEWNAWLSVDEYPKVYNPQNNRLWSANNRVVSGDDFKKVGYSRYDLGARAKQIRDGLNELSAPVAEKDLYKIMLDNRALFLDRWQKQLLSVLEASGDAAFNDYIQKIKNWGGHADINSVGYRLVRDYRNEVFENLMGSITAACVRYDERCNYDGATRQWEGPLWQLITEQPNGWLPTQYQNWQFFFEKTAFDAWQPVITGEVPLNDYTWGNHNMSNFAHPLSGALSFLSGMINMPSEPQNGDTENMPHIAGKTKGQSERMVVSPGYEEDGILDLPAGQSGHPLSPYFGAGHDDWVEGKMGPFLPQETKWKMEFLPAG